MIRKSLELDISLIKIKSLSLLQRFHLIFQKYKVLLEILVGSKGAFGIKGVRMQLKDISGLGTTQSSIIDFYNDIVESCIIDKKRPYIVDAGANIGQFCNAAKLFFPNAHLFSFEPDPVVYKQLVENTRTLRFVKTFNFGLGDRSQKLPFYVHDLSVMSSFKKYDDHFYGEKDVSYIRVEPLDKTLSTIESIDLLKIDVEGFELNVLKGAKNILKRTNYLLIEISLGRSQTTDTNLGLLKYISELEPNSKIVKFGRPLGKISNPTCQDLLIKLR